jgi:hypothetical protein
VLARAAFAPLEESKVVSCYPRMFNVRQVLHAVIFVLVLSLFTAASASMAYGQSFALTSTALQPSAVDPGSFATAGIDIVPSGGFDSSVSLSCAVTTNQVATQAMQCLVSPSSAAPNATVSLTVTASSSSGTPAPAAEYMITVTGTSGSETQTANLFLNVVAVPEDYTLTISKAISPGTVAPGSGAQATVTVTPIASYTGTVTLSCVLITPTVLAAPICEFQATSTTQPQPFVQVGDGTAATAILTVSTYGQVQNNARVSMPRIFYALWLAVPGLALVGAGAGGKHRRRLLALFFLMAMASGLLLVPSCGGGSNTTINNNNGLITPKNTYTITVTGVDQNGTGPSNTSTDQATVSLIVN